MPAKVVDKKPGPYTVHLPDIFVAPVVFSSPHSGRKYPKELLDQSPLKLRKLRSLEDCYVDELFEHVTDQGMGFIKADFPRAFLDLNREPFELDPKLIRPRLPGYANSKSIRVKGGLGTLPRIVADGSSIYRAPIILPDALKRVENFHKPYHDRLSELTTSIQKQFGRALLLDCHSMPSSSNTAQNNTTSDIVIGNRFDRACDPKLSELVASCLISLGFTVTFNRPYAGGYITEHHGQPSNNVHALQIELNRNLYLDQITFEKSKDFKNLQNKMIEFTAQISKYLADFDDVPLAAE